MPWRGASSSVSRLQSEGRLLRFLLNPVNGAAGGVRWFAIFLFSLSLLPHIPVNMNRASLSLFRSDSNSSVDSVGSMDSGCGRFEAVGSDGFPSEAVFVDLAAGLIGSLHDAGLAASSDALEPLWAMILSGMDLRSFLREEGCVAFMEAHPLGFRRVYRGSSDDWDCLLAPP